MRQISNPPVPRLFSPRLAWWRALAAALLVSVLLHGVALDFLRGQSGQAGVLVQQALRASLVLTAPEAVPDQPVAVSAERPDVPAPDRRVESAVDHGMAGEPAQTAREPEVAVLAGQAQAFVPGVRLLTQAEELVAYRLALLEGMQAPVALHAPLELGLILSAEEGGAEVSISRSSGSADVDQRWLAAFQLAASQVERPAALRSQVVSLVLEIQP